MYRFDFDPDTGILRCNMKGYWTLDVAERFAEELAGGIVEARLAAGALHLLLDFSEYGIQTPDVVDRLSKLSRALFVHPSDRIALCFPSTFASTMASRLVQAAGSERAHVFSTCAAARSWLARRGETQAAAA